MNRSLWLVIGILIAQNASAYDKDVLVDGHTLQRLDTETVARQIQPGTIVILSEQHDLSLHHEHQVSFLKALSGHLTQISVGMEFFPRTRQRAVDKYLAGDLDEADFLANVEWGGDNFGFYRRQVLFPVAHGGTTVALNAPRALTRKIARTGLNSLNDEERAQLPENFTLGNDGYKERFREAMGGHEISEEEFNNYFAAQSTWDETMSDTACQYSKANPEAVLTILVGDFHAQYGGGLPDRLKARGCSNVVVISQVGVEDLSDPAQNDEIRPHARWGARADYVWAVEVRRAALKGRLLKSMRLGLLLN